MRKIAIDAVAAATVLMTMMPSCGQKQPMASPMERQGEFAELSGGEAVPLNYTSLYPQLIMAVGGHYLLYEPDDSSFLVRVDTAAVNPPVRVARRGSGPMEFFDIRGEAYNPVTSTFFFYSQYARKAYYFDVPADGADFTEATLRKTVGISFPSGIYGLIPLSDDRLATSTPLPDGEKMFGIVDDSCRYVAAFGDYPGDKSGLAGDKEAFIMSHQTLVAASPRGDRFVAAGWYNDWLAFYAVDGDEAGLRREYFTEESEVKIEKGDQFVAVRRLPSTRIYYKDLMATDSYLYAMYDGHTSEEVKNDGSLPTYLLQFDWDGTLVSGYVVSRKIVRAAVTPDDRYLLAITFTESDDPDVVIMRYPLRAPR